VAPPRLPFDQPATALAHTYAGQLQARLGFDADPRQWTRAIQDRVRGSRAREAEPAARAPVPPPDSADALASSRDELAEGSAPIAAPGFFASLRYLGQLDLTYLVCEADGELVLVDQHVAHERVELARLKAGHGEHAIPTQRMLFPTTI